MAEFTPDLGEHVNASVLLLISMRAYVVAVAPSDYDSEGMESAPVLALYSISRACGKSRPEEDTYYYLWDIIIITEISKINLASNSIV